MKKAVIQNSKILLITASMFLTSFLANAQTQKGADIDGEAAEDNSGWSVSMPDANTVAIGAWSNSGSGTKAGQVRIYFWNGTGWIQKGIDIDGEALGDRSGWSVSMPDANNVAIGAYGNSYFAGQVRVFNWDGKSWIQKGADIDGEAAGDGSGISVSMPNEYTIAIGAPYNSGNGKNAGHTRIYNWNGNAWAKKGNDIDGEALGDKAGFSVSMPDANTVAVGAIENRGTFADTSKAGHVRVYNWNGTNWLKKGTDIDGEAIGDNSGWSVSMPDANTVAIGAPYNSANGKGLYTGHVRIFAWNGSAWAQKGSDIDGEATGDNSGYSVSMPDPNTIAIGAYWNSGKVNAAGHTRIYYWNGSAWVQKGTDIDGEAGLNGSGRSVNMPDENTLAIGAPFNSDNGFSAGHVRIFSLTSLKILKNTFGTSLKAFPNPTQGKVNIELGANYNDVSIIVRNATGQEVLRKSFSNANSLQINIPGEAGFYSVEVAAQDKKALLKVMKK
jgi:hypothetical protein